MHDVSSANPRAYCDQEFLPVQMARRKLPVSVNWAEVVKKANEKPPTPVKPRSKHVSQERWDRYERNWANRLEVAKQWKIAKGRFPKNNKKDKVEQSLYNWLREYMIGQRQWTKERWEKLNEAFGEGWEKECCPNPRNGPWDERSPRY